MFDRVIVSTDDSDFKKFWPMVCMAWNKFFPSVKVTCGFVTNRSEDDSLVTEMRKWGEVVIFPIVDNIPTASQGKMTRLILSTMYDNEICLIDDIDSIPLQRNYIQSIFNQDVLNKIKNNYLMALAADVYHSENFGKFPMGYITAKSNIFKSIITPNNDLTTNFFELHELYQSWTLNHLDGKESVLNQPIDRFSDESLLRYLLSKKSINIVNVDRNCDIYKYWIDRSWWGYDINRLFLEDYVMCNFVRPYNEELNKDIIEFLKK